MIKKLNPDWDELKSMSWPELTELCEKRGLTALDMDYLLESIADVLGIEMPHAFDREDVKEMDQERLLVFAEEKGVELISSDVDSMRAEFADALDIAKVTKRDDHDWDVAGDDEEKTDDDDSVGDQEESKLGSIGREENDEELCRNVLAKIDFVFESYCAYSFIFPQDVLDSMFGMTATPELIRKLAELAFKYNYAMAILDQGYLFTWGHYFNRSPVADVSMLP